MGHTATKLRAVHLDQGKGTAAADNTLSASSGDCEVLPKHCFLPEVSARWICHECGKNDNFSPVCANTRCEHEMCMTNCVAILPNRLRKTGSSKRTAGQDKAKGPAPPPNKPTFSQGKRKLDPRLRPKTGIARPVAIVRRERQQRVGRARREGPSFCKKAQLWTEKCKPKADPKLEPKPKPKYTSEPKPAPKPAPEPATTPASVPEEPVPVIRRKKAQPELPSRPAARRRTRSARGAKMVGFINRWRDISQEEAKKLRQKQLTMAQTFEIMNKDTMYLWLRLGLEKAASGDGLGGEASLLQKREVRRRWG